MKVLVLGIRGIPGVQGGVETHAEHLYPRIAALGCEVEAIVRTPFVDKGTASFGTIRLRRIWSPRWTGVEALVHSLLGVVYAGVTRPDILHVHAVGPALVVPLARLLGLRVVMTHHGPDYDRDKWGPMARRVLRLGERLGVEFSNARIVISSVIARSIERQFDRDSVLIPNGVVPGAPTLATDVLDRLGLQPGRYFLHVGRMVPEKRQLDLIRAYVMAAVPGWKLVLVGGLDSHRLLSPGADRGQPVGCRLDRIREGPRTRSTIFPRRWIRAAVDSRGAAHRAARGPGVRIAHCGQRYSRESRGSAGCVELLPRWQPGFTDRSVAAHGG